MTFPLSITLSLVEIPLVEIPAGEFVMGSPEQEEDSFDDEKPQHLVKLASFYMSQTPITQAQWREVAQWEEREGETWGRELKPNPSRFQQPGDARLFQGETSTDGRPVEQVSWEEAMEFCSRLSQRTGRTYTLPTEAQWEYACRAGTSTPFAFGETLTPELANYSSWQTTPVGMFPANAWGLQDMHGNVWEWCLDQWHEDYEGAPEDGSAWLAEPGGDRLLRGGSWFFIPGYCRSAYRSHSQPDFAFITIGFRVVCLDQWHGDYEGAPKDGSAWLAEPGEDRLLRGGSWDGDPGSCRSALRLHARPDYAPDWLGFRVVCLPQGPSLNG